MPYQNPPPRPAVVREVAASELKNAWHLHLDRVEQTREEVIVTRYGRPVAKLIPWDSDEGEAAGIFGALAGSVTVHADIIAPVGEDWEADG